MSNLEDWGYAPCPLPGHNTDCFSCQWPLLDVTKSAPKNLKAIFFQDKFYSKAHPGYFTILIYLATWRAAERGVFTHFSFVNLPQCSQSINSLMYVYYTDPQLLFFHDHTSLYYRHLKKSFCIISCLQFSNLIQLLNNQLCEDCLIFLKRWIRNN